MAHASALQPKRKRLLSCIARNTLRVIACVSIVSGAPRSAVASPRLWEPLIIPARDLPQLVGSPASHLEVIVLHAGRLEPIPFQVDEAPPANLPGWAPASIANISRAPRILDRDAELTVEIADFGERAARGNMVPRNALEIQISDPLGGPTKYAYIASIDSPQLSSTRYVDYEPSDDCVKSTQYRVGFQGNLPAAIAFQRHLHSAAPYALGDLNLRIRGRLLHIFPFQLSQRDLNSRILTWRTGPVRTVVWLRQSINLGFGIGSPAITWELLFYRDFIESPLLVKIPWVPRVIFDDIQIHADFALFDTPSVGPSKSLDSLVSIGAVEEEKSGQGDPSGRKVSWIALRAGGRTLLQTFVPSSGLSKLSFRPYLERSPGNAWRASLQDPRVGYSVNGLESVSKGTHRLDVVMAIVPEDYDHKLLLRELAVPPIIEIRPLPPNR